MWAGATWHRKVLPSPLRTAINAVTLVNPGAMAPAHHALRLAASRLLALSRLVTPSLAPSLARSRVTLATSTMCSEWPFAYSVVL